MRFIYRHYIKFVIGILVVVFLMIPIGMYVRFMHTPIGGQKNIQVKISAGMSSNRIVDLLSQEGLLHNKFFSKLYLKLHGIGNELKSGVYLFNTSMTPTELFNMLKNHQIDLNYVKFTIPEGYSVKQIGNKLLKTGLIKNLQEFIDCVNQDKFEYSFLSELPSDRNYRLEGYLYPATYEFEKGMTIHFITNKMLSRFDEFYQSIKPELDNKRVNLDNIMNVASMIEAEAKKDKDRELISAVIYNRLKANMKLQIDATVLYALGVHKTVVYLKDLRVDSPYNTYKYTGLPRGPISNPGEKSIMAALNPASVNYLYYIAKSDGTHYFTSSYKKFINYKKSLKKN